MPASRKCPHCGAEIPGDAPEGLCPRCLVGLLESGETVADLPGAEATTALAWAPSVGMDLGDYRLLECIGRGGMGIIYKARQRKLDRLVAIKVIRAGSSATRQDTELFLSEARTAAKVRHPNIIGVYEAGQSHGWHYIAMELIEGTSLADRLAGDQLPADQVTELMIKIARAVDHLHRAGIVHCDLKPANILLDREGEPYIMDFGLARILTGTHNVLKDGAIAGTPHYMSPEQASGRIEQIGAASDIYSLGAILYHMITGRPPFDAANPSDLLAIAIGRRPPPPRSVRREVSRPLETICLRCLEKAPHERYTSAVALADDLAHYLCGEPFDGPRIGVWQRVVKWSIRQPALAGRLIAAPLLYGIEIWFRAAGISGPLFHWTVSILLPLWVGACCIFQRMEHSPTLGRWIGALWALVDTATLTAVILYSEDVVNCPVVACYFVVLAGSGLWYRQWLVWVSALMVAGSYGFVWVATSWMQPDTVGPFERHVVFLACIAILAFIVSRLVHHIQTLSRRLRLS